MNLLPPPVKPTKDPTIPLNLKDLEDLYPILVAGHNEVKGDPAKVDVVVAASDTWNRLCNEMAEAMKPKVDNEPAQ